MTRAREVRRSTGLPRRRRSPAAGRRIGRGILRETCGRRGASFERRDRPPVRHLPSHHNHVTSASHSRCHGGGRFFQRGGKAPIQGGGAPADVGGRLTGRGSQCGGGGGGRGGGG